MADFEFSEDGNILIQVTEVEKTSNGNWGEVTSADKVREVLKEFGDDASHQVFQTIYTLSRRTSHMIRALKEADPDTPIGEVQLQFGLKLTAEKDVVIVKVAGEANINVSITWK
jgi:hypothetical protein